MLETDQVWMQHWNAADWADLRPIATDPDVMRYVTDGLPWTDEEIQEFVKRQLMWFSKHGFCMWKLVDKNEGCLIGFCGLQPVLIGEQGEIEIGWWLAKKYWGQGIATKAARVALADGFERALLKRIIAIAHPGNEASKRVMEKLGMTFERATIYKFVPVVIYSIHKE